MGCVAACKFHSTPPQKCNNNTLLYLRSHPLSEWRRGGFQEWLTRQDLWAEVNNVEDFARDLGEERDNVLADDVATVLAARYAALISKWDGEVDEKFEAKARVLNGLCRGVVRLQRGMHRAAKNHRELLQELEEKRQRTRENGKKKLLDQVWAIQREPEVAKDFGGGELGRKLARYIVAVENDVPGAKLEITDEDLKKAKQGRSKLKCVKPTRKEQTVQRARKTRARKVANPLEENEIGSPRRSRCGEGGSNPVKVNQTDLAPISPTCPTRPICPTCLTSPEEDSGAGDLQRGTSVF